MSDWLIRPAQPEDSGPLARVMRAALEDLGFVPTIHSPDEDHAFLAGLLTGADAWVAVGEDRPVGFIAVAKGVVSTLYVHPSWQARGIGMALLTSAQQDRASLTLHCFQQNAIARRFYEAQGFREIASDDEGTNDEGLPDLTYRWDAPSGRDLSKGAAWMDGQVIPIAEARIGVTDWGLIRSDITYDVASVWEGGFFRLDDYIERFFQSMASTRLDPGVTPEDVRSVCHAIVARSGLRAAYVAMVGSRGVPAIPGTRDPRTCANHFYAWCVPYVHVVPPEIAETGASVWVAKNVRRIPEDSVNPRAKNYHWGDITAGLFEAKDEGFETVVLLDHAGNVTEGPGFNMFAVKEDRVITADRGVLGGITRRTVLEMCAEAGLQTETRDLPLDELLEADELFLSTTGGGVVPVTKVDERSFSNGRPGPVTDRMRALYFDWRMRPEHRQDVTYAE